MGRLAIGDIVEYRLSPVAIPARIGTIGIVSDGDHYSDPAVTVIFPTWEYDETGEEIYCNPRLWKKIGRADL